MRTKLAVSLSYTTSIPGLSARAHDVPGHPEVTCIDFTNTGNPALPKLFKSIMLVPDGVHAPNLGADRTLYPVPRNYSDISLSTSLGVVGDRDFVVAQMQIMTSDDESVSHTHVACDLP